VLGVEEVRLVLTPCYITWIKFAFSGYFYSNAQLGNMMLFSNEIIIVLRYIPLKLGRGEL